MNFSYDELVQFLINRYEPAKCDYFTNEYCTIEGKISRTPEGLYCHHIDEDKVIKLSDKRIAPKSPFIYQKANRLVYCNILEHLLLHISQIFCIFSHPFNYYILIMLKNIANRKK